MALRRDGGAFVAFEDRIVLYSAALVPLATFDIVVRTLDLAEDQCTLVYTHAYRASSSIAIDHESEWSDDHGRVSGAPRSSAEVRRPLTLR